MVAAVRVEDVIGEVVDILRHTFDPRVRIDVGIEPRARVTADATLLNQALMNLCLNARDAMPDGGRLSIRSETVTLSAEAAAADPDARPGSFVRLTVEDTGTGMPAEVKARVFEPFFTTKPVGQGTGLGLAMVHGIVRQHHGWLACDSAPGRGTRFDLYLPVAGPQATESVGVRRVATERNLPAEVTTPPPVGGPVRTVLLVDDEELIRELGRSVLESVGYRVLEAGDGADAVELFRREHTGIDLVILDLMMPRVSGRDAFQAMTAITPDVRVLFSSGYSTDDLSDVTGSLGMLAKPYRPNELLAAVRRALAGQPEAAVAVGP
jgi:CheY-like chemotaxis protein